MRKKNEEEVVEDVETAEEVTVQEVPVEIERLTRDLGREDLNELRDAVNELFRR